MKLYANYTHLNELQLSDILLGAVAKIAFFAVL
jgi:hypothetical protein